jgi:hypothetical protein
VFATLAGFKPPYKVYGTAIEYVRTGDEGARFRFRFCPICGTNLFHTQEGYEDSMVLVAVGAFGDPNFPAPEDSGYECRKHSWVQVPEGIKRYDKNPD